MLRLPDFFSPTQLAKSVHDTLDAATALLPENKKHAILIDATQEQVQAIYVQKVNDNWQLSLQGAYDGSHVKGKIATAISW